MVNRVLDWRRRFDPRSLNYRVQDLAPSLPVRSWRWKRTIWLNQGDTPGCTGFAISHVLGTTPRRMTGIDNAFATHRYERAKQCDEWPGENYDGSSVLGACQASKQDGLLTGYFWSKTLEEILHAVSYQGPVDIGVDWYSGMMDPDASGFLHVTGKIEGGHSIQIGGVDVKKRAVILDNSWGQSWGVNGSALLSWEDLDKLRADQGEFALARKPRK